MDIPTRPAGLDPVVVEIVEALARAMIDTDNSKQRRLLEFKDGGESLATSRFFAAVRSVRLCSFDFDELLPSLSRNRIAGLAPIRNVRLNGFRAVIFLADASGQRWDAGNLASVLF